MYAVLEPISASKKLKLNTKPGANMDIPQVMCISREPFSGGVNCLFIASFSAIHYSENKNFM